MANKKSTNHEGNEHDDLNLRALREIGLTRSEKGAIFHLIMQDQRTTERVSELMKSDEFDEETMPV